jgi:hypothetical protein
MTPRIKVDLSRAYRERPHRKIQPAQLKVASDIKVAKIAARRRSWAALGFPAP